MAEENKRDSGGNEELGALAGKYLTFKLGDEEYGIEILKVVEIIKMMEITAVPRTPDFIRGVINLRGKVIPVMELRRKFSMDTTEDTDETCIIVVSVQLQERELQMGLLVDTVSEVADIEQKEIEGPPKFGSAVSTEYIMGMAKVKDGQVIILLNIDQVMSGTDLTGLV